MLYPIELRTRELRSNPFGGVPHGEVVGRGEVACAEDDGEEGRIVDDDNVNAMSLASAPSRAWVYNGARRSSWTGREISV